MCLMNQQPVNEYYSPCGKCPEYLNSCIPVIINGYIFIEKMKKANMLFWIQNNIYGCFINQHRSYVWW